MNVTNPLTLVVLNSEQLDINSQVQHQFDQRGGTLGASENDRWQLRDRLGAVLPQHARIEMLDGRFCLCDLSGQSFINGALSPIGRERKVMLSHGDELTIGPFRLGVYFGDPATEPDIDQVLGQRPDDMLGGWLSEEENGRPAANAATQAVLNDPLWALQQEQRHALLTSDNEPADEPLSTSLSSLSAAEDNMDQKFVELPTIAGSHAAPGQDGYLDSAALAPLMRGLGISLQAGDEARLREVLEDMGKSLRAVVEGLLALQTGQAALADTHLRPIEDNPLRLGLDYADTLSLLFAEDKSPVHLSAPAAVEEALNNVRVHHLANQQAIAVALESILQAFSPAALLNRFEHYRRSGELQAADDGWAWRMYQHYYRELTSPRQQGFQKLFHQVYAQAYDHAVRRQQEPQ
ncbi:MULTISPECIES: type VI secretion system-associated FHA domain protein TagH [Brenneria]|uniref:Type VI secretion system-associated FHA domain protein TagH n=1 Tax=Brenneria nigrifluens DSM 30175 = ATCC 13028 TaxID=1121120 RepID=A0A2U1UKA4_9GAMM|nr:FHA domain containing protein [Brenneria sp. EniD312]PWC22083.1 type VI secretion system-associated FHA domain protein TagH [Brenneria nigrifluens DSM 30175 = ATCC 13028]QCR03609.1 type VI secretion system-associated FHA domain protein TagH [Brenneria nigrifluens DSM 30175 = ATCC 13028]